MRVLADRVGINAALVAIGAAAAVLGTAKTLAEAVTGAAFSLGDLVYYTGNVAFVAYYGVAAVLVVTVSLLVAGDKLAGRDPKGAWVDVAVVLAPLVAGIAAAAYGVLTFEWNPDARSGAWPAVIRIVGVGAVVAAVVAYRRPAPAATVAK